MSADIQAFMEASESIAMKFDSKELPGLLSKELVVPSGAVALINQDRKDKCLQEKGKAQGSFSAIVVKTKNLKLSFEISGLKSEDDIKFRVSLAVVIQARTVELDLLQLRTSLISSRKTLLQSDIHSYFKPAIETALKLFCVSRPAQNLTKDDQRIAVYQHLRQDLQKTLLETGFDLKDVRHPNFESQQYDSLRQQKIEGKAKEEALVNEKRLEMLRKELDKEVILKDLEAQGEIERRKKAVRVEHYEEIRERMGEDDLKAMVMLLDDDNKRAALIKELIEKDMSPEQRGNIKLGEIEGRLETRLREFQSQMASLTGAVLEAQANDPVTKRILAVVGKRVLSFDPSTNLHPEVPKEVYDTSNGQLGYLRSVRHQLHNGKDLIMIGAQRGVYKLLDGEQSEYLFPNCPEGKGGANSVSCFDERLFASHSELGIVEWKDSEPDSGETVYNNATSDQSSSRGVTIGLDGRLYFSAGSLIYAFDLLSSSKNAIFKGSRDSVTAFHLTKNKLIAGNKSGQILEWDLSDPNSPRESPVKKKNPIYMLRSTRIAGQEYLIIGSKDYTVTLASPDKDLYREYHAKEQVRWVDGAGDFIIGVSRSGYKIFAWDVQKQSEPCLTIRVSDKVQDLFVIKTEQA
jgi:hypothetical protein